GRDDDQMREAFTSKDQRKRNGAEEETNDDDRLSPQSIGEASADRLCHHGRRELAAQDDCDLGVVEPYSLGVDRQEAEESAVPKIHDRLDAGGDQDRRRRDDFY